MKNLMTRCAALAGGLWLAAPSMLVAHEGYAGDHGWLAGAMQPTLGLDHFLAALFVGVVTSVGLTVTLRRTGHTESNRNP